MRMIFVAAALLPLATPAAAAEWYLVGGNDSTRTYVDLASLRALSGKIVGDVLSVYAKPLNGGPIVGAKIREELDCGGNYFRTLEYSYYRADGSFIESEPSETITEHKTPAANSINEAIMDFACYRKGGTAVSDPFSDAADNFDEY